MESPDTFEDILQTNEAKFIISWISTWSQHNDGYDFMRMFTRVVVKAVNLAIKDYEDNEEEKLQPVKIDSYAFSEAFNKILPKNIFQDLSRNENIITNAICSQDLKIVKFLAEKDFKIDEYAISYAARKGDVEMVKYLRLKGLKWSDCIWSCEYENACKASSYEMLEYLMTTSCSGRERVYKGAKDLKMILWLKEHDFCLDKQSAEYFV